MAFRCRTSALAASLLILLLTLFVVAPSLAHARSSSRRADAAAAAAAYDPDEMEGLTEHGGEIILEDDDEPTPVNDNIWVDPSAPTVIVPPTAMDPDRTVKSLDWLHVHVEVRTPTSEEDDNDDDHGASTSTRHGRLLDSTRKLGRSPWIFQFGSGSAMPQLESALAGIKIGERRTIPLTWRDEYASIEPRFAASSSLADGDEVVFVLELVRFDLDVKELTLEDRFWNLLPMLAFFAFMGFRIMRGGYGQDVGADGNAAPTAGGKSATTGARNNASAKKNDAPRTKKR
jgi:hypothetical protein